MADAPIIVPASADDVAYFARRRYSDEHGRRLYADLAHAAPNGVFVAKDESMPIGVAIAHALEDEWFLSEIFVERSFQGRGIGTQLLDEAAKDAGDVVRSGLIDPGQLGGVAFFLRRAVALQSPVVAIAGAVPHSNEVLRMAAGEYRFGTQPLEPVGHRSALAELDRMVRGTARRHDHLYFSEYGRGFVFTRGEEVAGYVYVWPSGRVGPMVAASQTYVVQFLSFALIALRENFGATWCTMLVPGTNVRIVRAAMRAGLSIEGVHVFASDGAAHDLSRYVGFHPLLF
jgi:GNAT superfamily N-acetyltransferase